MKRPPFSPQLLASHLSEWPRCSRYVVLASGGCDSTALIHALWEVQAALTAHLVVLHFDHGIAEDSSSWCEHVRSLAQALGLRFYSEQLRVLPGGALETRARKARYERLAEWMRPGDCCLLAHHADDQAETFVLQALRGTGPAGLAAMPSLRRFGSGWLGRPLLAWTRAEIVRWANVRNLTWIEDPGNRNSASPRNRLRHELWPLLLTLWPDASRRLSRSASLAAEAANFMSRVAEDDLQRLGDVRLDRLSLQALDAFGIERRRNLIRYWLRSRDLPVPSATKLKELERTLLDRDPGPRAVLVWPGAEARRYQGQLHIDPPLAPLQFRSAPIQVGDWLDLGVLGRIGVQKDSRGQLSRSITERGLELRFRRGGESMRLAGQTHHRLVKKLLQEAAILPWMRSHLPLLFVDGRVAEIPGIGVAAEYAGSGLSLVWKDAPKFR